MESVTHPRWFGGDEADGYQVVGTPIERWPRERDLVNWLIGDLHMLGRVLGMRLEMAGREVGVGVQWQDSDITGRTWWVGGRRLDLDLRNERGQRVIVEAQLGGSDHGHLGQLVSYARQADAEFAVWVLAGGDDCDGSTGFYPDHLDALAELNEVYAGRRTFVAVDALPESPRCPTPEEAHLAPLLPRLRRIDLVAMTYAAEPNLKEGG